MIQCDLFLLTNNFPSNIFAGGYKCALLWIEPFVFVENVLIWKRFAIIVFEMLVIVITCWLFLLCCCYLLNISQRWCCVFSSIVSMPVECRRWQSCPLRAALFIFYFCLNSMQCCTCSMKTTKAINFGNPMGNIQLQQLAESSLSYIITNTPSICMLISVEFYCIPGAYHLVGYHYLRQKPTLNYFSFSC